MPIVEWFKKIFSRCSESEDQNDNEKKYVLLVITDYGDGYGSHWYGWSRGWLFAYDEALKKKEEIKDRYFDVEIIEY